MPRWIALLSMTLVLILSLWIWATGDFQLTHRAWRRAGMDPAIQGAVDRASRHQHPPGDGWPVAADGRPHRPARRALGPLLLERDPAPHRLLPSATCCGSWAV
ncbi:hypothetical protein ACPA9J_00565 [Pseudomonas aeruginosa]